MSTSTSSTNYPSPAPAAPAARTKPGHWVLLVFGVLLTLIGLALTAAGAFALSVDSAQRDGQYLTGETESVQTTGYAFVSPSVVIDPADTGGPQLPPPGELASVRVRVTPMVPDQEIFLGVGPAGEVSDYLQDVPHSSLGDVSWKGAGPDGNSLSWSGDNSREGEDGTRVTEGSRAPADPAAQDFWVESASGAGTREITWDLAEGQWSLVVMNADASRPVWVDIQPGVRSDLAETVVGPVGTGLLPAGLIGLVLGILLLLLGAAGLGRGIDPARTGQAANPLASTVHPVRLTGVLDPPLSRGLWLIKWLLAIPHYIILALLVFAQLITTIAAGIAILITGRYPRSWFLFSEGVLRWSWRVGFYSYSALGTDRYPPFTLAPADYPAQLTVAYPERLSRGLVLVKWWLLAIPHLLIVGILTGGGGVGWMTFSNQDGSAGTGTSAPSLLGLLVLIAAVMLLFTARYRAGIFALIMGINRWVYRVMAYVLLLRDDYPPFRLDQGPHEPTSVDLPGEDPGPGGR